ncbi:Crp/Fnr family transcriptional regulator [Acinetobacter sp. P8-3-8]|uniref:Crp/Fnr family transcriptional regulator n=1 Tax=Acinetobacter sp. P8-3-8 TaxID=1029823 RepID=UPI0002485B6C|nr:Crp/Fnr family transcriptional regulator [Acinetobacter sp. P8-3-8]
MLTETELNVLQNNVWYSQLPSLFQDYITQHATHLYIERDQAVFHHGDPFDGIYAVIQGKIRLGYIDIEGNQSIAAIVEPIMWFGEISLVDQQPRSHHAIAVEKSTILKVSSTAIEQILKEQPQFWFHIAQLTSQKLRIAFLELIAIQTLNISQRLAQRLLFILNGYGNHVHIENHIIHLSQEQLAQMLMCSRQTINQELHLLEQQGILKIAFRKVEILDVQKLHALAHSAM